MHPLLHNAAVHQHHDLVGSPDCARSMSNYDMREGPPMLDCITSHGPEACMKQSFTTIIKSRGTFVVQKHPGASNNRPSDSDTLFLSSADGCHIDGCVVFALQLSNEIVRDSYSSGMLHFSYRNVVIFIGPTASKTNVVSHGSHKQSRFLLHDTQHTAKRIQIERPNVYSIQADGPSLRIVQTLQELQSSRFSTAATANKCNGASGFNRQ